MADMPNPVWAEIPIPPVRPSSEMVRDDWHVFHFEVEVVAGPVRLENAVCFDDPLGKSFYSTKNILAKKCLQTTSELFLCSTPGAFYSKKHKTGT